MSGLGGGPAALLGVDAGRCRRRTGRGWPGHDLGDPGGWSGAVRLGAGRFGLRWPWSSAVVHLGERRPVLVWHDDLRGNGGALDGVRALPAKDFSFGGCIRRPMGHPAGPTTCTAVRGVPPLRKKVVSSQRMTKVKVRSSLSLPLLTCSAPGGLRQDPGRAAESAAGPRTNEDMGPRRACVVVDRRGTR